MCFWGRNNKKKQCVSLFFHPSPKIKIRRTVVDPYLNLFRGLLPPLGQIDLSPILAFVVLDLFSNAAAALPAEMPEGARPPAGAGRAARRGLLGRGRREK